MRKTNYNSQIVCMLPYSFYFQNSTHSLIITLIYFYNSIEKQSAYMDKLDFHESKENKNERMIKHYSTSVDLMNDQIEESKKQLRITTLQLREKRIKMEKGKKEMGVLVLLTLLLLGTERRLKNSV
jgi:hypothetical protein